MHMVAPVIIAMPNTDAPTTPIKKVLSVLRFFLDLSLLPLFEGSCSVAVDIGELSRIIEEDVEGDGEVNDI